MLFPFLSTELRIRPTILLHLETSAPDCNQFRSISIDPACSVCAKTASAANLPVLNACAKCKTTLYCSRDCQKADWSKHEKICGKTAPSEAPNASSALHSNNSSSSAYVNANAEHRSTYSAPRLRDLEKHVPNPFTCLDLGTYLHNHPEKNVYKLLIDSFRIGQADDKNLENKTTPQSVYTGASSSIVPSRKYLTQAAKRAGLLPTWWNAEKQKKCEAFGESGAWQDLRKRVEKQEMIQHYGYDKVPMQMRMLAEAIYGRGSMGQSGAGARKMLRQMESGGPGNEQHMSMLNISRT